MDRRRINAESDRGKVSQSRGYDVPGKVPWTCGCRIAQSSSPVAPSASCAWACKAGACSVGIRTRVWGRAIISVVPASSVAGFGSLAISPVS